MKHEIIKTENYLLAVDDSEIKEGDYHVAIRIVKTNGDKAIAFTDQEQLDAIAEIGGAKKIIAHLPLNNAPFLEGVDVLPPLEQEDDVEKLGNKFSNGFALNLSHQLVVALNEGFKEGYNKAREKYKYTEEDMRGFHKFFMEIGTNSIYDALTLYIQSLSQQKIPIGFKCQTFDTGDDKLDGTHILGIRTTTNSQGQSVWEGEYIYA